MVCPNVLLWQCLLYTSGLPWPVIYVISSCVQQSFQIQHIFKTDLSDHVPTMCLLIASKLHEHQLWLDCHLVLILQSFLILTFLTKLARKICCLSFQIADKSLSTSPSTTPVHMTMTPCYLDYSNSLLKGLGFSSLSLHLYFLHKDKTDYSKTYDIFHFPRSRHSHS